MSSVTNNTMNNVEATRQKEAERYEQTSLPRSQQNFTTAYKPLIFGGILGGIGHIIELYANKKKPRPAEFLLSVFGVGCMLQIGSNIGEVAKNAVAMSRVKFITERRKRYVEDPLSENVVENRKYENLIDSYEDQARNKNIQ
ncbi:hypothetical protein AKO1_012143 [Acrasis kona]|uniref:Uncharacterized protein n=1 Tax=Acrasis kona TaxID=1008807 RepID=A0AAW2ZB54_9EUKA